MLMCPSPLQRFAMIFLLRSVSEITSSSEDASCLTSFGLLSSLFSKFCPCGEAAGLSRRTKLDVLILCAHFWCA